MSLDRPVKPDPYELLPKVPSFTVTSHDVTDGQPLKDDQVAEHGNAAPQLSWSGAPAETKSYTVTCFDPDAPTPSGFWHWAVVDLPAEVTALTLGAGDADSTLPAGRHIPNDGGLRRYVGAGPPPGPAHHYYIVVTALDVPTTGVPETASHALTFFQTLGHVVARA